ncbi:LicD family protein [Teichococcus wenyumeiae]|uniref:LicD family protein n=1 Tax=Teichococcus wenyumeiae TaxID=2478470 RepID=UPI0011C43622|nr:LicD family protein [Pseudoroseomonas wenyumeiae]
MHKDLNPEDEVGALAARAFPSFGFFGDSKRNALTIPVEQVVDKVVFRIEAPAAEILNLGAIRFFSKDAKEIKRPDLTAHVEASSIYGDKPKEHLTACFLGGSQIHTKKEIAPSLTVSFKSPAHVSKLVVANRGSEWGVRSMFLCVEAYAGEKLLCRWENNNAERRKQCFVNLAEGITQILGKDHDPRHTSPETVNLQLRKGLAEVISSGKARQGNIDWAQAIAVLDFYNSDYQLQDEDLTIIAHYILYLMGDTSILGTSQLAPFSRVLRSKDVIRKVMQRLNEIAPQYRTNEQNFIISKHQINNSVLHSRRELFLNGLDQVIQQLREWNLRGLLCYGSLLGAVRENDFIAHDDDVDVLYVDHSTTRAEAERGSHALEQRFRAAGYSSWRPSGSLNFNVSKDGVSVDLFPCWFEGDQIQVMMEKFQYRPIQTNLVLPPGEVELCGRKYPAPADPAGFLAERYGENWKKPDQFYEWPWQLED